MYKPTFMWLSITDFGQKCKQFLSLIFSYIYFFQYYPGCHKRLQNGSLPLSSSKCPLSQQPRALVGYLRTTKGNGAHDTDTYNLCVQALRYSLQLCLIDASCEGNMKEAKFKVKWQSCNPYGVIKIYSNFGNSKMLHITQIRI